MHLRGHIQSCLASVIAQGKGNPATVVCVAMLGAAILVQAARLQRLTHAVAYLLAMLTCAIMVETVAQRRARDEWIIKAPRREGGVIALALAIMATLGILRFIVLRDGQQLPPLARIVFLMLVVLFIYPLFLLVFFTRKEKYRLRELGITWSELWLALPVIGIVGLTAVSVAPEHLQFRETYQRSGALSMLLLGFGTAALPEEFMRVLTQTRLASLFANKGLGWFAGGVLWALLHIPIFSRESGSVSQAIMSAVGILPIGLLWGYMTERLKSIAPSVLVHGTNLWGLQNVF